ncbi:hypothetical protein V1511DRAFT_497972 [Dipodascopsis uninucleata]
MAALKRKQPYRDGKKHQLKKNKFEKKISKDNASEKEAPPSPTIVSTLKKNTDDIEAFPRGGASVLTPLEYKETINEAKKDALFESSLSESKSKKSLSDSKSDKFSQKRERLIKKQQRNQKKSQKNIDSIKSKVKIEGLTFKNLVPGTLVLGQIAEINSYDIALSLPNSLTGYIPMTKISDEVSEKLETLQNEIENDDQEDDENDDSETKLSSGDVPDLQKYFKVGQWLRGAVSERKGTNLESRNKKHIELSIKPEDVNTIAGPDDIVKGLSVQASIISIEDHGAIMNVGIDNMTGFISNKELDYAGYKSSDLQVGQTLLLTVLNKPSNGRTITLTATPVAKNMPPVTAVENVNTLVPGTLVEVIVSQVTHGGLSGTVAGLVDGTIDFFHCASYNTEKFSEKYKDGQKIKARVVSSLISDEKIKIKLSLLSHVMSLSDTSLSNSSILSSRPFDALPLGEVVQTAKVRSVEPSLGVFLETGIEGVLGFVHISRLSDSRVEEISSLFGPYRTDTIHTARVIGYSWADGLYIMSLQDSVLNQKYMQFDDVKIGDIVEGEVTRIIPSGGILVQIQNGIVGHVNELHLSDVKVQQPERRFRPGMRVKCRVLSVKSDTKRIKLTLKKSMLSTDITVVSTYEGIERGQKLTGNIIKIVSKGAIIEFFGALTAFLPITEMTEAKITDPREKFHEGQTVNVRVVSNHPEFRKMRVSCKEPKKPKKDKKEKKSKSKKPDPKKETEKMQTEEELDDEDIANSEESGQDSSSEQDVTLDIPDDDSVDISGDDENKGDDEKELEEDEVLNISGFDWDAKNLDEGLDIDNAEAISSEESEDEDSSERQRKRRKKSSRLIDITGELNTKDPESVNDFERMLLGSPNSSSLWIRYMAFQVQLGEIEKSREIARRALKTINFRDEEQKQNIWIALLNLEHNFGTKETLEETFKESCIYMDPDVMKKKLSVIQKQRAKK